MSDQPKDPVLLAQDLIEAVSALAEERAELRRDLDETQAHLEDVEEVARSIDEAKAALAGKLADAHRQAGHRGPWSTCPDPVCSFLEEWAHREFGPIFRSCAIVA